MTEPFTFYKALDPVKGSWDGYGFFPLGSDDFLAFVADAPTGASIHTPQIIHDFWKEQSRAFSDDASVAAIEIADAVNQLQLKLQSAAKSEGAPHQATLAVARKIGNQILYACVGDSNIQLLRDQKLYRLNEVELWDGRLILNAAQKVQERQKTASLQFIGTDGSYFRPVDVRTFPLRDHDLLVLTTDGFDDVISPDRMMQLIAGSSDLRNEFERIFIPQAIRDDVTFVSIPIKTRPEFSAQREIHNISQQVEIVQRQQAQLREHIKEFQQPDARLQRIESQLQQMSREFAGVAKKIDSLERRSVRVNSAAPRFRIPPWFAAVVLLLIGGAAAAAYYFSRTNVRPSRTTAPRSSVTARAAAPQTQIAAPPEIPPEKQCEYIVQRGDSLAKVAQKTGLKVELLKAWNPSHQSNPNLQIGEKLTICGGEDEVP